MKQVNSLQGAFHTREVTLIVIIIVDNAQEDHLRAATCTVTLYGTQFLVTFVTRSSQGGESNKMM